MKQITTILLLLISLSGIGQVSPPTSHTIKVAGSGTSGGTTKYSTTEYGMLTDSATAGLYKFRADSTVLESQARAVNRAELKANVNNPTFTGLVSAGGATPDSAITTTSLHVTTNMRVDGNVGVGTIGSYPLSVVGNGATSTLGYFEQQGSLVPTLQAYMKNTSSNVSNNTVVGAFGFGNYFNSSYSPTTQNIADMQGVYLGNGTTQKGGINFRTHNGTAMATVLNVNDSGRVLLPLYASGSLLTTGTAVSALYLGSDGSLIKSTLPASADSSATGFYTNFRADTSRANIYSAIASGSGANSWIKTGNSLTAGGDFLGSTNNVSLRIRTNNIEHLSIDSIGTVNITAPSLTGSAAQGGLKISQTWNTTGSPVAFQVSATNTASGGSTLLADFQVGGSSVAYINKAGTMNLAATNAASYGWAGRSRIWCNADGIINLSNNAQDNITRVNWGSTTSAYPSIARNAATLEFKLADNSAFTATQSLYDRFGSGSPESVVTAPIGAVYHRTDGGAGTSFYVKESGSGNTGWISK